MEAFGRGSKVITIPKYFYDGDGNKICKVLYATQDKGRVNFFTEIIEPDPEKPLIVKSGNTWVAHYKGSDFLCVNYGDIPENITEAIASFNNYFEHIAFHDCPKWLPFSEIELTDEIALLRPMVIHNASNTPVKLYGVRGIDCAVLLNDRMANCVKDFMILATAKELSPCNKN